MSNFTSTTRRKKQFPTKLYKLTEAYLTKELKMRIVKVDKEKFELEDGCVYPIEPPLENVSVV